MNLGLCACVHACVCMCVHVCMLRVCVCVSVYVCMCVSAWCSLSQLVVAGNVKRLVEADVGGGL